MYVRGSSIGSPRLRSDSHSRSSTRLHNKKAKTGVQLRTVPNRRLSNSGNRYTTTTSSTQLPGPASSAASLTRTQPLYNTISRVTQQRNEVLNQKLSQNPYGGEQPNPMRRSRARQGAGSGNIRNKSSISRSARQYSKQVETKLVETNTIHSTGIHQGLLKQLVGWYVYIYMYPHINNLAHSKQLIY